MNPAQRNLLQEFFDIWNYPLLALREDSLTIGGLVLLLVLGYLLFRYGPKCNSHLLRFIQGKVVIPAEYRKGIVRVTRALVFIAGACLIVKIAKIDHFIFGQINELYDTVHGMFDLKLFKFGKTDITLWALTYLMVSSLVLVRGASAFRHWLGVRVLARAKMQAQAQYAVGASAQYVVLFLGFVVLLQSAGIDLSAITVMVGALGIGLSFGLQQITNNFICGLILLFERPIRIGDKVQVSDVVGTVQNISLRATTIITGKNIAVLVPNAEFITAKVQNWTLNSNYIAVNLPFNVDSTRDPQAIADDIKACVAEHPGVSREAETRVLFEEISGSKCKFNVIVNTEKYINDPDQLRSDLLLALTRRFKKPENKNKPSNIVIPFAASIESPTSL